MTSLDRRELQYVLHVSPLAVRTTFWIELMVQSPIVPGQPVTFAFSIYTIFPVDIENAIARLYLVDDQDHPVFGSAKPLFEIALGTLSLLGIEAGPGVFGGFNSDTFTFVPPTEQQNTIYEVNGRQRHFLRVALTGDGPVGPLYSTSAELQVAYEAIDASWWVWDSGPQSVGWKIDHYTLGGQFTNKSVGNSTMTCNVVLRELDLTTFAPDHTYGPDDNPQPIAHGGTAAVKWGNTDFTKTWEWFLTFVDSINGETSKLFGYIVEISITDNFQNTYPNFVSSATSVRVTVSDQKLNAAHGGEIAFAEWVTFSALAIATSWIPGVGAAFGALASAALATNGGLSNIAKDPPEPDPRYREPVTVAAPKIESALQALPQFKALARFFELSQWIVNSVDALGQIESRLLGAKEAEDKIAYSRQKASYVDVLATIREYAIQIQDTARQAASSLDMKKLVSAARLRKARRAVQSEGLLTAIETLLVRGQVDETLALIAGSATHAPQTGRPLNELGRSVEELAATLAQLYVAVERNAKTVLSHQMSAR